MYPSISSGTSLLRRSLGIWLLGLTLAQATASLPDTLRLVRERPVIDGKISPGEWKSAITFEQFEAAPSGDSGPATKAWVMTDGSWLYIAFQCKEPNPAGIVAKVIADEKDGAVWNDDSVEVFVDPGNTGRVIYHFIANSQGTYYNSKIIDLKANPSAWSSEARVHTGRTPDGWEIEIALPLASMHHIFEEGEIVGINLARNRHAGGGDKPQASSIAGGAYAHPSRFIRLLVGAPVPLPDGSGHLITTKAGPFLTQEAGAWEFQVTRPRGGEAVLEFVFPSSRERRTVKEGTSYLSFPFKAGEARKMQQCDIRMGEERIAGYAFDAQAAVAIERIARTENPLFEAAIEPIPDGLAKEGFILWPHQFPSSRSEVPNFWLRTAMAMTNEEVAEWYRKHRAIRMGRSSWYRTKLPATVKQRELHTGKGNAAAIYLLPADYLGKDVPIGISHSRPWELDPRVKSAYLEDVRKVIGLTRDYPEIRWLFAGDETWEIMHRNLLHFLNQKDRYPELAAVDQEIREKYGFGKFGLPLSETDTNPFRWIATRRWEIDQMIGLQAEVRRMVQEKAPHLKMMSWDNISGHRPYGLHRWAEVFDVITGQLYPARTPERQVFTFLTHWYRDLTGAHELWPLPHFENYSATFNKEETEELFSQLFRGGATGLHLYLADTIGGRRKAGNPIEEIWGAPERWAVASSVASQIREQPFRVRQPKADTGIFYSNTSYAGQGAGSGAALMYTNEVEWIYTLLGPHLKSAIRFLDEGIADRTADILKQLKVVYLPYGPILDDAEYQALEAFVRAGGTLVVCDPLAFRHRSDGTARTEGALLVPLKSDAPGVPQLLSQGKERGELSPTGPSYQLTPSGKDEVVASYSSGEPAIITSRLGQGRVVKFGMNPLAEKTIKDTAWINLFGSFQKESHTTAATELWRFRFPSVDVPERERPEGICLSGNYFEWTLSEPEPRFNSSLGGSYEISRSDHAGSESAGQPISFKVGKLTDRLKGAKAADGSPGSNYVLEWKGPEALEIRWKFPPSARPRLARIFYRGHLPAGSVGEIGPEGAFRATGGQWEAPEPLLEEGLRMLVVELSSTPVSEPVLRFEPAGEASWTLAEIEWWGEE